MTKKRIVSFGPTKNLHHRSDIATHSLMQKKKDLGAFTNPFTIRAFNFSKVLYDLWYNTNLIPLVLLKQLGLKYSKINLLMKDHTMKHSIGIMYDILVKVDTFILPANFIILDCEVDFVVPIILGEHYYLLEENILTWSVENSNFYQIMKRWYRMCLS